MERINLKGDSRGSLKHISKSLGFDVQHEHFAQSSCIETNWLNQLRKEGSVSKSSKIETVYESLISSLSKKKKTGEWIVYSKNSSGTVFWCIWLHESGDEKLIELIKTLKSDLPIT